jgi:hypothetical protein
MPVTTNTTFVGTPNSYFLELLDGHVRFFLAAESYFLASMSALLDSGLGFAELLVLVHLPPPIS